MSTTSPLQTDASILLDIWKSIAPVHYTEAQLTNNGKSDPSGWLGIGTENVKEEGEEEEVRITRIEWINIGFGGQDVQGGAKNTDNCSIPSSFSKLPYLKTLLLDDNNFSGTLPTSLASLHHLQLLSFTGNPKLTGGIHHTLSPLYTLLSSNFQLDAHMNMTSLEFSHRANDKKILLQAWTKMSGEVEQLKDPYHNGISEDVSDWHQVVVKNGRVTEVNWSYDNLNNIIIKGEKEKRGVVLKGEIPECLGELLMLERLDLSARKDENGMKLGKLSGFIPKELHTLENLKYLYLSGNDLIISIPTEFAKLEKANFKDPNQDLEKDKKIVMTCWKSMGGDPDLLQNNAGDDIMQWVGVEIGGPLGKSRVTKIEWPNKSLRNSMPPELAELNCLKVLDLGNNNLTGAIPKEFEKLTTTPSNKIEKVEAELLDMENSRKNEAKDILEEMTKPLHAQLTELRSQPTLEILNLSANKLTGDIPPYFANFKNLLQLNLNNNHFTGGVINLAELAKTLADPVRRINKKLEANLSAKVKAREAMEQQIPILFENIRSQIHPNVAPGEKLYIDKSSKRFKSLINDRFLKSQISKIWDDEFLLKNPDLRYVASALKENPEAYLDPYNGCFDTDFGDWTFLPLIQAGAFTDARERLIKLDKKVAETQLSHKDNNKNSALHLILGKSFHDKGLLQLVELMVETDNKCLKYKGENSNLPIHCYCMNGEDLNLLCFLIQNGGVNQLKEKNVPGSQESGHRPIDLAEMHATKKTGSDERPRENWEQFKTILEACNPIGGHSSTKIRHPDSGNYLQVAPDSIFVGCIRDLPLEELKEIHEKNKKALDKQIHDLEKEKMKLDVHRLDKNLRSALSYYCQHGRSIETLLWLINHAEGHSDRANDYETKDLDNLLKTKDASLRGGKDPLDYAQTTLLLDRRFFKRTLSICSDGISPYSLAVLAVIEKEGGLDQVLRSWAFHNAPRQTPAVDKKNAVEDVEKVKSDKKTTIIDGREDRTRRQLKIMGPDAAELLEKEAETPSPKAHRLPISYYAQHGSNREVLEWLYDLCPGAIREEKGIDLEEEIQEIWDAIEGTSDEGEQKRPSLHVGSPKKSSKNQNQRRLSNLTFDDVKSLAGLGSRNNVYQHQSMNQKAFENFEVEAAEAEVHNPFWYALTVNKHCAPVTPGGIAPDDERLLFSSAMFGGHLGDSWSDFKLILYSCEQGNPKAIEHAISAMALKEKVDLFAWQNVFELMLDHEHFTTYFVYLLDATWEVLREESLKKGPDSITIAKHLESCVNLYMKKTQVYRPDILPNLITMVSKQELQQIANTGVIRQYLKKQMDWRVMTFYYIEATLYFIFVIFYIDLTLRFKESPPEEMWEMPFVRRRTIGCFGLSFLYFMRDMRQLQAQVSLGLAKNWFGDYWNYIDVAATSGTIFVFAYYFNYGRSQVFNNLTALVSLFNWMKVLGFAKSFSQPIATFVLMINQIILDLRSFMLVLMVVLAAFGHAFYLVLSHQEMDLAHDDPNPFGDLYIAARTMYMALLGDFEPDAYSETFEWMLFVMFSFLVMIILLNVLIAIVSDSYDAVLVNSSQLFWRSRLELVAEIQTTFKGLMKERPFFTRFKRQLGNNVERFNDYLEDKGQGYGREVIMGDDDNHWASNRVFGFKVLRTLCFPLVYVYLFLYLLYALMMLIFKWLLDRMLKFTGKKAAFELDIGSDEVDSDWTGRVLDIVKRVNQRTTTEVTQVKLMLAASESRNAALILQQSELIGLIMDKFEIERPDNKIKETDVIGKFRLKVGARGKKLLRAAGKIRLKKKALRGKKKEEEVKKTTEGGEKKGGPGQKYKLLSINAKIGPEE
ncbi:hypothetical protein TL16_g11745 [Triparma laevis f. inornata]|uniref:Ion transport domain-containing protein n=1 Tax=Triparma laevis f. inornata TaxID=1714386 RepID=A0A9W7BGK7_9STRA|nr:hypothetical protein TL16_g11745 [Triparma laevis f. inornata]